MSSRWAWCLLLVALWLGPVPPAAAAPDPGLKFSLESHATPTNLCPFEPTRVAVTVRNVGQLQWSPQLRDRLAYHWLDADGAMVDFEGIRTDLPAPIEVGDSVTVEAIIRAPKTVGRYQLQWAMLREGAVWYPEPSGARAPIEVAGHEPALSFAVVDAGAPISVRAGGTTTSAVTIRNTGCAAWDPARGDRVAYRWYDGDGRVVVREGDRTPIAAPVAPGQSLTVDANVVGPPTAGAHWLRWEPIREGARWHGWPTAGDPMVPAAVGDPALSWGLVRAGPVPQLHADDRTSMPVVVENRGDEPWSEAAGDRMSYRFTPLDGGLPIEGVRTPWPQPVEPGAMQALNLQIEAPPSAGAYRFEVEPVREGVAWLGPPHGEHGPPRRDPVVVEVGQPRLSWAVVSADTRGFWWAGRTDEVAVTVRNTGTDAWSEAAGDRLSYRWRDTDGEIIAAEGLRTVLPHAVAPGASVDAVVRVRGPQRGGIYELEVAMVREHVRWFPEPAGSQHRWTVRAASAAASGHVLWLAIAACGWVWARRRRPAEPLRAVAWAVAPVVAVGAAAFVITQTFADRSGVELSSGGGWLAASAAAMPAAVVAALPGRARGWGAVVASSLLGLLTVADLAYMHFFGSIVPMQALAAVDHLFDASASVGSLLHAEDLWLLLPVAAAVAWGPAWPHRRPRAPSPSIRRALTWGVPIVAVLASAPAGSRVYEAMSTGLSHRVFSERDNVARMGLLGTHAFQLLRALREATGLAALSPERRAEVLAHYRRAPPAATAEPDASPNTYPGANVAVVQVEALQGWVIGARVGGVEVTPFLNRASTEALYFTAVADQTAQGRTSDAEYLVLASNHPLEDGALSFLREDDHFVTITHALRAQGYDTLSAHPYERGFWNRAVLHPRYGFGRSAFRREFGPGPVVGWGLADGPFLRRALPMIEDLKSPWFAFLITLSLHHPYEVFPESLRELDLGELEGTPLGNYLHAMRHADRALEGFVEELRSGAHGPTVIAVYGDHVSRLETPPAVLALAGIEQWDPSVPARLRRVPLLIWTPDDRRGRSDVAAGQIDIGPTLLRMVDVEIPGSFLGRDIASHPTDYAAWPDGGGMDDAALFVRRGRGIGGDGSCFTPGGRSRPIADCAALSQRIAADLRHSRAVLDHDLYEALAPGLRP